MMKKLLLTGICWMFAWVLQAQDQEKKIWTLRECIDYALQNNLNVKRSLLSIENSEIGLNQSKFQMLPTLNGGSTFGYNWGRSIDPTTNLFDTRRINSFNVNASSSFLLFNGFRLVNNYKSSALDNEASNEDFNKAKNDVILSVITFYTNVIFNRELFLNAQSQLATTTQQLERTRKLAEAGSVPRGNVLDLEAQQATNELNLINRENALNLSILQLKQALQLPASIPMEIEVPDLGVDDLIISETADEIFAAAKEAMPQVKSAQLRLQSALYAWKASRGSLYPRLNLNGNLFSNYSSAADRMRFVSDGGPSNTILNTTKPIGEVGGTGSPVYGYVTVPSGNFVDGYSIPDQLKDNISRSLSLSLQIPIFNGYQARASMQRSFVTKEQASITLKDTENQLRQAVETAYNDAMAASKTYQSAVKQVAARDEAYRMTKQRFESGAVNFVEYQTSENALFQAKSDLVRAKYDFIFKRKVLDFYQGKPIDF
jgi:outer membrane protein